MGLVGNSVGYYDWLEEDRLARWMSEQHVVEAVLGDPDPSGTRSVNSGNTSARSGEEGDDEVFSLHRSKRSCCSYTCGT